ncbi:hypothetical protein NQ317_017311 [Molorchus minor]|uniref:CN hydrolase domain-containing protein n=1 Tax=Molorchus minor TaxID=1323400 RepID=A0ABQ9K1X5_9CUCU|nr:hypothetical protein NQ317_017311 [Molorchus minor]
MSDLSEFDSVENILKKLGRDDHDKVSRILFGKDTHKIEVPEDVQKLSSQHQIEIVSCGFDCKEEQLRSPKIVRVGIFQHQHPVPTSTPIKETREAAFKLAGQAIELAAKSRVNIFCFQEAWSNLSICRLLFCTREKITWCEYAESAEDGPTTMYLAELAKQYNMVIISPILERDHIHGETIWNTAVVIDNHGDYIGKHRKNHIPRVGDFNESTYYFEGNTGHPVFETEFGKIAINICYGRHHPLNWLAFGINGAEIVFNPSATVGELSEPLWGIEARNAAIANGYFTCAINRVGTEHFENAFTSGDGKPAHKDFGHFYGSSYVAAPNGSRSPGLPRTKNAILIAEMDLNLCRQVKDHWGFQMTQRLEMYAELLNKAIKPDFTPQIIKKK